MSKPATAEQLRCAIDRLVASGQRVFGWGWVAHDEREIRSVSLRAQGAGWQKTLAANFGLARPDVAQAFPDLAYAGSSGFVVTGYLPAAGVDTLSLDVAFPDGTNSTVDVTHALEAGYASRRRARVVTWLARAVWRRLRRGDLRGLASRVRAQTYALPALDDAMDPIADALRARRVVVVLDHNMGGGANQYRRAIVAARVAAGMTVLLCTHNLPTLDYRVEIFRPGEAQLGFRLASFVTLERIAEAADVAEIFVNSPVSFDEPLVLAEWLARMRATHPRMRLTLTVHDYFPACPSFVLLNAQGRFCGIPHISECAKCLPSHPASYVALSPPTEIGPWRALWGRCLDAADEVRCFSESSRTLLLRAYPNLDRSRLTIVPHRVDFAPARRPRVDPAAPLAIGVVGQISAQKGANIVRDLVAQLDRERRDTRVVVIGTLDVPVRSARLHVTGTYQRDDLPSLIERHGLNAFLFPSVCPETFSYVVEELIALDVPVVAFDLGAPAERLARHPKARLCADVSAQAALAAIDELHASLARHEAAAQGVVS